MKWVKYNLADGFSSIPNDMNLYFIRYGDGDKLLGDKSEIHDLYETGWNNVEWLDESSPDYYQQRCEAAEDILKCDTYEKRNHWQSLVKQQP